MSEVKRILKSVGAALLVMVAAISGAIGGMYGISKLSEKQCIIFLLSSVALVLLGIMSLAFYMDFGPKPPAPPTT